MILATGGRLHVQTNHKDLLVSWFCCDFAIFSSVHKKYLPLFQSYDINLHVTCLVSRLAMLPHPHLHEFLLNPLVPTASNTKTLYKLFIKVQLLKLEARLLYFVSTVSSSVLYRLGLRHFQTLYKLFVTVQTHEILSWDIRLNELCNLAPCLHEANWIECWIHDHKVLGSIPSAGHV